MNSSYFFPTKYSLKSCKSLLIECTSDSGNTVVDRILKACKHLKPNKLKVNFLNIYKIVDKVGPLRWLDIFNALTSFNLKVEGALLDQGSSYLFKKWMWKALNLKRLSVVIEKGSPQEG